MDSYAYWRIQHDHLQHRKVLPNLPQQPAEDLLLITSFYG